MTFPAKTIGQTAAATALRQEAVMGQAIPRQHPAVVLRSHFNQIRALLAVAMVAVVGLTAAVVILATDDDAGTSGTSADALSGLSPQERMRVEALSNLSPAQLGAAFGHATGVQPGTRYDGGPEEGTADITAAGLPQAAQPKVTQQRAFPGLAKQAREAQSGATQSPASPSKSATKDYSLNGATGDFAPPPKAQSGSRADGSSDDSSQLRGPGHRTN
jgi:hypothetical protein